MNRRLQRGLTGRFERRLNRSLDRRLNRSLDRRKASVLLRSDCELGLRFVLHVAICVRYVYSTILS